MKKKHEIPNKNITIILIQENHFQITILPLGNNHLTDITTEKDLQIEEIHEIFHKIDIFHQTVKTINIEIIIQDNFKKK